MCVKQIIFNSIYTLQNSTLSYFSIWRKFILSIHIIPRKHNDISEMFTFFIKKPLIYCLSGRKLHVIKVQKQKQWKWLARKEGKKYKYWSISQKKNSSHLSSPFLLYLCKVCLMIRHVLSIHLSKSFCTFKDMNHIQTLVYVLRKTTNHLLACSYSIGSRMKCFHHL